MLSFVIGIDSYDAIADEYRISGTVTKKGGGPLKGVVVLLKGKNVSVVTGDDGKFEIAPASAIRLKSTKITQPLLFMINENTIKFSPAVDDRLNGSVSIFSGNGRRISSIDFYDLVPGKDNISLPRVPAGINILRVCVNSTVYTCQLIRIGSELHIINRNEAFPSEGNFLLAKKASSDVVDTLIAAKENFKESVTPIKSYTISDILIEMDSIVGGIAWGREENPTARCKVGKLPEYNELTKADYKLPDPFMKLDGTRIRNKSEWACRREEILQCMFKYIYG